MRVVIASAPDRQELFAEIYQGSEQWAEVARDPELGSLVVTIWSPSGEERWVLDLRETIAALTDAEERLG